MLPTDLPADSLTTHKSSTIQVQCSCCTAATVKAAHSSWLLRGMSHGQDTGKDGCSGWDGGPSSTSCHQPYSRRWQGREQSERRVSTEQHFPRPRALPQLRGSLSQRWDLCIHLFLMDLFSTKASERKGTISLLLPALFIISGHYKLPACALYVSPGLWPHAEEHPLLCRGLSPY